MLDGDKIQRIIEIIGGPTLNAMFFLICSGYVMQILEQCPCAGRSGIKHQGVNPCTGWFIHSTNLFDI